MKDSKTTLACLPDNQCTVALSEKAGGKTIKKPVDDKKKYPDSRAKQYENNLLFSLLRTSLYPDREPVGTIPPGVAAAETDWKEVRDELEAQALTAIPLKWLQSHSIPDKELHTEWLYDCYRYQANWILVMEGQAELLALLEANGISCVIIKGSAAGMAYPEPHLRAAGDVDFLVRNCDFKKAAELLINNGYKLAYEKNDRAHHYCYVKDGTRFELHKRLSSIRESDGRLIRMFEEGILQREYGSIGKYRFPVLPPDLNGLSLIFHINQHLQSGLGLRQIIDWMMYVDRLPGEVWETRVLPLLQRTGMERLALTVTAMCQKYLGLRTIVSSPDQYPCDALMEYILAEGNFGKKAGKKGKVASVFSYMASPIRVLRRLQIGGMCRWKLVKRYRILTPFAWVYQIGFIARELCSMHISPREFFAQRTLGKEQRAFFSSLGLNLDGKIRENQKK